MKYFLILLLTVFSHCANKQENSVAKLTVHDPIEKLKEDEVKNNLGVLKIDRLWEILTQKDGCLTGGQYVIRGQFGGEGCIMSNSVVWQLFFKMPKADLTKFLVTRLDKRDTTRVHTCPFFMATEGELATYALQAIHKKNWFDFGEFRVYEQKVSNPKTEMLSSRDNFQGYLNDKVLTNPREREKLKNIWLNELKK